MFIFKTIATKTIFAIIALAAASDAFATKRVMSDEESLTHNSNGFVDKQAKVDQPQDDPLATPDEATLKEAVRLLNLARPEKNAQGIALLSGLSNKGHAQATYYLASCHLEGRGTKVDQFTAMNLYLSIANKFPDAHYRIGLLHVTKAHSIRQTNPNTNDEALKQLYWEAQKHFYYAVMKDHAEASIQLGALYKNGFGVVRDNVIAADFYLKLINLNPNKFDLWVSIPENMKFLIDTYADMCAVNKEKLEAYCAAKNIELPKQ